MPAPFTIANLRKLSDEDLIAQHDSIITSHTVVVGLQYYIDEIKRRESSSQQEIMLAYTRQIRLMTIVITAATVVYVLMAAIPLFRG